MIFQRPVSDRFQCFHKCVAARPVINMGNMQHLETRLIELPDPGMNILSDQQRPPQPIGKEPSLGVGINIELNLPDILKLQLLIQRQMGII